MNKKKVYDLIFSLGEACSCTAALRESKLQVFSYPFDWLYGCSFLDRIDLLTSDFKNFIDKEDLELIEKRLKPSPCDVYKNNRNGLIFNHDFPLDSSFDLSYTDVKSKYDRRIKRLLEHISQSKKVLVVFIKTPEEGNCIEAKTILIDGLKKLSEKFVNIEFDILTLTNDINMKLGYIQVDEFHQNITNLTLNYKSLNKLDHPSVVNMKMLRKTLMSYKVSSLLGSKKNNFILKLIRSICDSIL